jgi:hypothetical protein
VANSIDVDSLIAKFGTEMIPRAVDYQTLIELAAVGARAVGDAGAVATVPGDGLTLNSGKLALNAGPGVTLGTGDLRLSYDSSLKAVEIAGNKVLAVDRSAELGTKGKLQVQVGPGFKKLDDTTTKVTIQEGAGVKVDSDGLTLKVDGITGLGFVSNKLAVKLATDGNKPVSGLTFDADGKLAVNVDNQTVELKSGKLQLKLDPNGGLDFSGGAVRVKPIIPTADVLVSTFKQVATNDAAVLTNLYELSKKS